MSKIGYEQIDNRVVTDCRTCDFRDDDVDGLGGGAECTLDGYAENPLFIEDHNSATPPTWCGLRSRTVLYRLAIETPDHGQQEQ